MARRVSWSDLDIASLDFGMRIGASDWFFNEESCTASFKFEGGLPTYEEVYAKIAEFKTEFESEWGFQIGMIERWQYEPRIHVNLLTGEKTVHAIESFLTVRWPFRNLAAERAG